LQNICHKNQKEDIPARGKAKDEAAFRSRLRLQQFVKTADLLLFLTPYAKLVDITKASRFSPNSS